MYHLGIDLGTTWTAAAVCRAGARGPEPVPLGEHGHAVASVVFAGPDGSFLLGEAAERRARSDPDRVVREFKRRIGDPAPVVVGREAVPAEVLAARFVAALVQQVARREGAPPGRIAVTHPAGWGPHRIAALRGALAAQGVAPVLLLTEPQAAAVGHAHGERVAPDSVVAVHDLGGGTFDAAVVRKDARGDFALLGEPRGSTGSAGSTSTRPCSPTSAPRSARPGPSSTAPTRRSWRRWRGCGGSARRPRRRCRWTPWCTCR
jgi:molecular chaperone DnaK (HSP70)